MKRGKQLAKVLWTLLGLLTGMVLFSALLVLLPAWLNGSEFPLTALRSMPPLQTERIEYAFYESLSKSPLLHLRLAWRGKAIKGVWLIAYRASESDWPDGIRALDLYFARNGYGMVQPDPDHPSFESNRHVLYIDDYEIFLSIFEPEKMPDKQGLIVLQVVQY